MYVQNTKVRCTVQHSGFLVANRHRLPCGSAGNPDFTSRDPLRALDGRVLLEDNGRTRGNTLRQR